MASGCVPLGGDHISNDITLMTGIPLAQAELLKKTEGDANSFSGKTNEMVRVRGEGHMKDAAIERNVLNEIIRSAWPSAGLRWSKTERLPTWTIRATARP